MEDHSGDLDEGRVDENMDSSSGESLEDYLSLDNDSSNNCPNVDPIHITERNLQKVSLFYEKRVCKDGTKYSFRTIEDLKRQLDEYAKEESLQNVQRHQIQSDQPLATPTPEYSSREVKSLEDRTKPNDNEYISLLYEHVERWTYVLQKDVELCRFVGSHGDKIPILSDETNIQMSHVDTIIDCLDMINCFSGKEDEITALKTAICLIAPILQEETEGQLRVMANMHSESLGRLKQCAESYLGRIISDLKQKDSTLLTDLEMEGSNILSSPMKFDEVCVHSGPNIADISSFKSKVDALTQCCRNMLGFLATLPKEDWNLVEEKLSTLLHNLKNTSNRIAERITFYETLLEYKSFKEQCETELSIIRKWSEVDAFSPEDTQRAHKTILKVKSTIAEWQSRASSITRQQRNARIVIIDATEQLYMHSFHPCLEQLCSLVDLTEAQLVQREHFCSWVKESQRAMITEIKRLPELLEGFCTAQNAKGGLPKWKSDFRVCSDLFQRNKISIDSLTGVLKTAFKGSQAADRLCADLWEICNSTKQVLDSKNTEMTAFVGTLSDYHKVGQIVNCQLRSLEMGLQDQTSIRSQEQCLEKLKQLEEIVKDAKALQSERDMLHSKLDVVEASGQTITGFRINERRQDFELLCRRLETILENAEKQLKIYKQQLVLWKEVSVEELSITTILKKMSAALREKQTNINSAEATLEDLKENQRIVQLSVANLESAASAMQRQGCGLVMSSFRVKLHDLKSAYTVSSNQTEKMSKCLRTWKDSLTLCEKCDEFVHQTTAMIENKPEICTVHVHVLETERKSLASKQKETEDNKSDLDKFEIVHVSFLNLTTLGHLLTCKEDMSIKFDHIEKAIKGRMQRIEVALQDVKSFWEALVDPIIKLEMVQKKTLDFGIILIEHVAEWGKHIEPALAELSCLDNQLEKFEIELEQRCSISGENKEDATDFMGVKNALSFEISVMKSRLAYHEALSEYMDMHSMCNEKLLKIQKKGVGSHMDFAHTEKIKHELSDIEGKLSLWRTKTGAMEELETNAHIVLKPNVGGTFSFGQIFHSLTSLLEKCQFHVKREEVILQEVDSSYQRLKPTKQHLKENAPWVEITLKTLVDGDLIETRTQLESRIQLLQRKYDVKGICTVEDVSRLMLPRSEMEADIDEIDTSMRSFKESCFTFAVQAPRRAMEFRTSDLENSWHETRSSVLKIIDRVHHIHETGCWTEFDTSRKEIQSDIDTKAAILSKDFPFGSRCDAHNALEVIKSAVDSMNTLTEHVSRMVDNGAILVKELGIVPCQNPNCIVTESVRMETELESLKQNLQEKHTRFQRWIHVYDSIENIYRIIVNSCQIIIGRMQGLNDPGSSGSMLSGLKTVELELSSLQDEILEIKKQHASLSCTIDDLLSLNMGKEIHGLSQMAEDADVRLLNIESLVHTLKSSLGQTSQNESSNSQGGNVAKGGFAGSENELVSRPSSDEDSEDDEETLTVGVHDFKLESIGVHKTSAGIFLDSVKEIDLPKWDWDEASIEVKQNIGDGTYGKVELISHPERKDCDIVAKQMKKGLDDYCIKLFAKELRLVCDLNHKNIVTLFAFCADPVCLFVEYMVFDWKEYGKSYKSHDLAVFLETLDKTNGVDSFHKAAHFTRHIATDVAEGLEHIHKQDIAHRDLKLHNILVSNTVPLPPRQKIRCKITDFGEARAYCVQTNTIARSGTTRLERGTLPYLAPEVILGSCKSASLGDLKRMDIWAYGMVLLCVLNPDMGHPFSQYLQEQESMHRPDFRAVMLQFMNDENMPEISSKYSFLREKYDMVERVRLMCLQYDPSKRPNFSKIVKELKPAKKRKASGAASAPEGATTARDQGALAQEQNVRKTDSTMRKRDVKSDAITRPSDSNALQLWSMKPLLPYQKRIKSYGRLIAGLMDPDEVVAILYEKNLISHEVKQNADKSQYGSSTKSDVILTALRIQRADRFDTIIKVLSENGQQGLVDLLTGAEPPCEPAHWNAIRTHHRELTEVIDPAGLSVSLYGEGCLSIREKENIDKCTSRWDKVEMILDIVRRKPFSDFMRFVKCLTEENQGHIAEMLTAECDN